MSGLVYLVTVLFFVSRSVLYPSVEKFVHHGSLVDYCILFCTSESWYSVCLLSTPFVGFFLHYWHFRFLYYISCITLSPVLKISVTNSFTAHAELQDRMCCERIVYVLLCFMLLWTVCMNKCLLSFFLTLSSYAYTCFPDVFFVFVYSVCVIMMCTVCMN